MKKWAKALIWLCIIWILVIAIVQVTLSERSLRKIVESFTTEYVDGDVGFSKISLSMFSNFPNARLSLENVSITYPTEKFAQSTDKGFNGKLTKLGRGENTDTLATLKELSISLNYPALLWNKIRIPQATLTSPRVFIHQYSDGASNLDIFKFIGTEDEQNEDELIEIPDIIIADAKLDDKPQIVYTNSKDTLSTVLHLNSAQLDGRISTKEAKANDFVLNIDELKIAGRNSTDSLGFALSKFEISKKGQELGLDARAIAALATATSGRMGIPVEARGKAQILDNTHPSFMIDDFDAVIGGFPLQTSGKIELLPDRISLDIIGKCKSFDIGKFIRTYGKNIDKSASELETNALLNIDTKIQGDYVYTKGILPPMDIKVNIPNSKISHKILAKELEFGLDASASSDSTGRIGARISRLNASCPGLLLNFSGKSRNLMAADPLAHLDVEIEAITDSLKWLIPENTLIKVEGNINADIEGDIRLSQMNIYHFTESGLEGNIKSGKLSVSSDSLKTQTSVDSLLINLSLPERSIEIMANEFNYNGPDSTMIVAKNTSNKLAIQELKNPEDLPTINVSSWTEAMTYFDKVNRARIVGMGLDLSTAMDTTGSRKIGWNFKGNANLRHVIALTPYFPLKNSIDAFEGEFDNNSINLKRLLLNSGDSRLIINGQLGGFKKAMKKEGPLELDLSIKSPFMNLDELMQAWSAGSRFQAKSATLSREMSDKQFEEELQNNNKSVNSDTSTIVIPKNVNATILLNAKDINWQKLSIKNLSSSINMKDGCIQMKDFIAKSNMGDIFMDCFYSSKNSDKLQAGFDLALKDITANDVIGLMPAIDTIMPSLKSFKGRLNCELAVTTDLDNKMNLLIPSATGVISIKGDDLSIKDSPEFKKLAKTLLMKNKKEAYVKDLRIDGLLENGSLNIFPFKLNIDRYKIAMSGKQNMDMSFKYHLSVLKSPVPFRLGVDISGPDFSKMKIHLGKAKYKSEKLPSYNSLISTMRNNLITSIKNVHNKGVSEVFSTNEKMVENNLKKTDDMVEKVEMPEIRAEQQNKTTIIRIN